MKHYETIFIINPNLGDEEYGNVLSKFRDLIGTSNGVIVKVEEWGKQKLAYELKKFDNGIYVLVDYCGDPGLIVEFERNLKLDERVLKYQTVKLADKADPEALLQAEEEKKEKRPVKPPEADESAKAESPAQVSEEPADDVEPPEAGEPAAAGKPAEAVEPAEAGEPVEAGKQQEETVEEGAVEEKKAAISTETDESAAAEAEAPMEASATEETLAESDKSPSAEADESASAKADSSAEADRSASAGADISAEADRPTNSDEVSQEETTVKKESEKGS